MMPAAQSDNAAIRLDESVGLARLVGYCVIIDLLLLPYLQLVIVPLSLPVVCLAFVVFHVKIRSDRYAILYVVLAAAAALSLLTALFLSSAIGNVAENFKRFIQLTTSFSYFFFFRWLASRVPLRLSPIVLVFVAWFGALALAFVLAPGPTGDVIRSIYGRLVTAEDVLEEHLRFAYVFSDPNTAGYFLLVAGSALLAERKSTSAAVLIIAVLAALTFLTQSRGAMLALFLMVVATFYPPNELLRSVRSVNKVLAVLIMAGVFVGALIYLKATAEQSTGLVKLAYTRLFDSPESYSTGGQRLDVWKLFISDLLPLPLGRGYVLAAGGVVQGTHSDLIRLLYSYGMIGLSAAVMFLFHRLMSYTVLMIPALMAFLINSLLDEQKLFALFLTLLAIAVGSEDRLKAQTTVLRDASR
jgi:hypothetical protein